MTTTKVTHVEIKHEDRPGERWEKIIVVTPYWSGVDRPQGVGYALPDTPKFAKLAARLQAAMMSMAMYPTVQVRTDNAGQTYASADYTVRGRCMSADLRALGY